MLGEKLLTAKFAKASQSPRRKAIGGWGDGGANIGVVFCAGLGSFLVKTLTKAATRSRDTRTVKKNVFALKRHHGQELLLTSKKSSPLLFEPQGRGFARYGK